MANPKNADVDNAFIVSLLLGAQRVELRNTTYIDQTSLRATVPAEVAIGVFDIEVRDPRGRVAVGQSLLTVSERTFSDCTTAADCEADPCSVANVCEAGTCVPDRDLDGDGHVDSICGGDDCDDDPGLCGASCSPTVLLDGCDGFDNDCDTELDEDPEFVWHHDADGDGFTYPPDATTACSDPDGSGPEWLAAPTDVDCDDNPNVCGAACSPAILLDVCDGFDNDCDTELDEDPEFVWHHDADGDGFTYPPDAAPACDDPDGSGSEWLRIANDEDCADTPGSDPNCNGLDGSLCHPGNEGADVVDGADNDCDGETDEDGPRWYHDADADSFASATDTMISATDPDGAGTEWVSLPALFDCDDDLAGCGAACAPDLQENESVGNCEDTYDNDCDDLTDDQEKLCGPPIAIFRSVGTADPLLATVTGTVTISGTSATFSQPMPDNIGVGDVLELDTDQDSTPDALALIHGRVDSRSFTVASADGLAPPQVTATSVWYIHRAYGSLADAENGDENPAITDALEDFDLWAGGRDLMANNEQWSIACYADGADTTPVVFGGWTTSTDRFVRVYAPTKASEVGVSQGHHGAWDAPSYLLSGEGEILTINISHMRLEGLRIESGGTFGFNAIVRLGVGSDAEVTLAKNLVRTRAGSSGSAWSGIGGTIGSGSVARIVNNAISDIGGGGNGVGAFGGTWYLYNNTIYSTGAAGIWVVGIGTVVAVNNVVQGASGRSFSGSFASGSDFNISDDTSSTGGTNDQTEVSLSFTDPVAGDLHLSPADTQAIDQGADLSGVPGGIDDDFEGDPRSGAWSIGADEP